LTIRIEHLKRIVEETDTKAGLAFDLTIQTFVILSVLAFSVETLPDLSDSAQAWLYRFEVLCVLIFTAEYGLRTIVSTPRTQYLTSFFGIVDLLAILPFYIGLGIDLRSVRAFRLLRMFRLLKIARYNSAVRRFHIALNIAREELILFFCATLILLYLAAVGIHYFESEAQPATFGSVFHCLWWAVATLTTVGYGDVFPITVGGRIFTFLILIIGLGFISVPAGLVASSLAKARQIEADERENDNSMI
jgi:voltage-gated potassium channel